MASVRAFPRVLLLAVLVIPSWAKSACAHEFWFEPAVFVTGSRAPGDSILISAYVGTGFRGEVRPYAPSHTVRLDVGDQDLKGSAINGDLFFASVAPDPGGVLVSYVSTFTQIQLPPDEFDRYLATEGLDGPLAARRLGDSGARPGRERYRRCVKLWIPGKDAPRATKPAGLPLEIVPLADPSSASPLTVRVLLDGRPLAGALVRAWHQPLDKGGVPFDVASRDSVGPSLAVRTDGEGSATLALDGPGEWLLSTVHMVPCTDHAIADWESTWASMTFARLAGKH